MHSDVCAASSVLSVNNLEVVYDDVIQVLSGVSLTVPEGKIVALLGANGAGKTTLLRAVTGLLDVHDGEIAKGSVEFDGQPIDDMLPEGAGDYSVSPNEAVFRQSEIHKPDEAAPSGVSVLEPFFTGPSAKDFTFEKLCYQ